MSAEQGRKSGPGAGQDRATGNRGSAQPFPVWNFLLAALLFLALLAGTVTLYYARTPLPWEIPWHVVLLGLTVGWGLFVAFYFLTHSGKHRQVPDLEATAHDYPEELQETRGPLTWFLIFTYVGVGIWLVVYAVDRILRGLEYGHLGQ